MLPQWKPAFDLYKKRAMPTSCYPQACQFCLRGEGPHNLLFVPLLLRKYFLNSSFSVYFYYSCFLPWFTPILSYLFAFQTPVWFIMANLPQKDFKKLLLSWLWTVFICLGEPEGERVFRGYLCVGDSWAEAYKLTPITTTSAPNQIPLLQIADMRTDTLSSDVIIYRPGPATLNVKTFLHHVKLMRCYVHSVRCVKWVLSAQGAHLRANITQRDQTLIYSQLWLLCLLILVRFVLPSSHPTQTHTHKPLRKKGMKRPSHWLTTDPWLSFEKLCFQIKLSGLKGGRCHSRAPGRLVSQSSLEGLTCIFLSCQRRVMGVKENRGVQRSSGPQI